jgi:hypothetical protein
MRTIHYIRRGVHRPDRKKGSQAPQAQFLGFSSKTFSRPHQTSKKKWKSGAACPSWWRWLLHSCSWEPLLRIRGPGRKLSLYRAPWSILRAALWNRLEYPELLALSGHPHASTSEAVPLAPFTGRIASWCGWCTSGRPARLQPMHGHILRARVSSTAPSCTRATLSCIHSTVQTQVWMHSIYREAPDVMAFWNLISGKV